MSQYFQAPSWSLKHWTNRVEAFESDPSTPPRDTSHTTPLVELAHTDVIVRVNRAAAPVPVQEYHIGDGTGGVRELSGWYRPAHGRPTAS